MRVLHLTDVGHVGHGTAGIQVREHHLLMVARQDVRRLRHEMDAAEDDVVRVRLAGGDS